MKKIKLENLKFKTEALKKAVEILVSNNYQVLVPVGADRQISYATFGDNSNVGYMQSGSWGYGLTISTVHKPCKKVGTGYSLEVISKPDESPSAYTDTQISLELLKTAFVFAPNWAFQRDFDHVKKYAGINDYLSLPINNIVKKATVVG